MHESQLLDLIYARSAGLAGSGGVVVGPGDDCSVVEVGGHRLLLTTDQVVEGRHFEAGTPPGVIARKAVARSISDIAAMGGEPWVGLASGVLPKGYAHADELCAAMHEWGQRFGAPVVGGDIASADGPLMVTASVVGRVTGERGAVLRSGAEVGDLVCVSGLVGSSFASGWHCSFEPRVREALWLVAAYGAGLHAMVDTSDGLGRDAGRVASASGVRIEVDLDRLPLRRAGQDAAEAAGDGEDYELLFTVDAGVSMAQACPETGTPFTVIGRVVEGVAGGSGGSVCVGVRGGAGAVDLAGAGWDHG